MFVVRLRAAQVERRRYLSLAGHILKLAAKFKRNKDLLRSHKHSQGSFVSPTPAAQVKNGAEAAMHWLRFVVSFAAGLNFSSSPNP